MATTKQKKDKKVQLWCTEEQLERIDEAAEICGLNRTSFMISAALEKARALKFGVGSPEE